MSRMFYQICTEMYPTTNLFPRVSPEGRGQGEALGEALGTRLSDSPSLDQPIVFTSNNVYTFLVSLFKFIYLFIYTYFFPAIFLRFVYFF